MPREHLFLELDNQPRWRCLGCNCLRLSKTNPFEGTQINTMCTLATAHIQKPLALQLQHMCLQSQLGLCFPWHWWLTVLPFPCRFQMQTPTGTNDLKIAGSRRPSPLLGAFPSRDPGAGSLPACIEWTDFQHLFKWWLNHCGYCTVFVGCHNFQSYPLVQIVPHSVAVTILKQHQWSVWMEQGFEKFSGQQQIK